MVIELDTSTMRPEQWATAAFVAHIVTCLVAARVYYAFRMRRPKVRSYDDPLSDYFMLPLMMLLVWPVVVGFCLVGWVVTIGVCPPPWRLVRDFFNNP